MQMPRILSIIVSLMFLSTSLVQAKTQSGDSAKFGSAVNSSAEDSQSQNQSGQGMSTAFGALFLAMSASEFASQNYATGAMYAAMGAASMIQAGENGSAADSAGDTMSATDAYGGTGRKSVTQNAATMKAIQDSVNKINKISGGKLDLTKGTFTDSKGKKYSSADVSSPSAMSAAGFSVDQIAQAMALVAKAEKKMGDKMKLGSMTGTNGFEEGGGGGGSNQAFSTDDGSASSGTANAGAGFGGDLNREPSNVAGMSKNFNGEPIGVSSDSIFAMMNRRYILKEKQDSFLNESSLHLKQK